jgi:hemoglobin
MKNNFHKYILLLFVTATIGACTTMESQKEASLYDRLGGKKAIQAVINDFVDIVIVDERIYNQKVIQLMGTIDIDQLKAHLVDQVCMGTGGPC